MAKDKNNGNSIVLTLNVAESANQINSEISKVIEKVNSYIRRNRKNSTGLVLKADIEKSAAEMQTQINSIVNKLKVEPIKLTFVGDQASAKKAAEYAEKGAQSGNSGKKKDTKKGGRKSSGTQRIQTAGDSAGYAATGNVEKHILASGSSSPNTIGEAAKLTSSNLKSLQKMSQLRAELAQWKLALPKSALNNNLAMDQLNALNSRLNTKLGSEGGFRTVNEAVAATKGLKAQFSDMGYTTKTLGDEVGKAFNSQAIQKFASMLLTTTIIGGLTKMYQMVSDIDMAFTELKKVSTASLSELDSYLKRTTDKSAELGVTISDLVSSTADFSRLGFNLKDSEKLAEVATKFYKVGDEFQDINEATSVIVSSLAAWDYEDAGKAAERITDEMNAVSNNYSISAAGLADAMQRSAASLSAAGMTTQQAWGVITGANAVVQDPESVGTMLKTMMLRLQGAKAELEEASLDTDGMASSTAKLRKEIMALTAVDGGEGVDIMDSSDPTKFKNAYESLGEIAKAYEKMDSKSANARALLELISGKRGANIAESLLRNWSMVAAATKTAEDSAGSANEEYSRWQSSIEGHTQKLQSAFQKLSMTALEGDQMKKLIDLGTNAISVFTKLVDTIGLIPLAIGSISAAQKGGLFGLGLKYDKDEGGWSLGGAEIGKKAIQRNQQANALVKSYFSEYEIENGERKYRNKASINALEYITGGDLPQIHGDDEEAIKARKAREKKIRERTNEIYKKEISEQLAAEEKAAKESGKHFGAKERRSTKRKLIAQYQEQSNIDLETSRQRYNNEASAIAAGNKQLEKRLKNQRAISTQIEKNKGNYQIQRKRWLVGGETVDRQNSVAAEPETKIGMVGSAFKSIGSGLKSLAGSAASMLLNAGIGMAVGVAADFVFDLIDKKVNEAKYAAEASAKNISNYEAAMSKVRDAGTFGYTTNDDGTLTASDKLEKLMKLQKGVSDTGKNIGLSNEQFKEYVSLANEAAELMPGLVVGWDENNNAILKNIGSVRTYNEEVKKQKEQAAYEAIKGDKEDPGGRWSSNAWTALDGGDSEDALEDSDAARFIVDRLEDNLGGGSNGGSFTLERAIESGWTAEGWFNSLYNLNDGKNKSLNAIDFKDALKKTSAGSLNPREFSEKYITSPDAEKNRKALIKELEDFINDKETEMSGYLSAVDTRLKNELLVDKTSAQNSKDWTSDMQQAFDNMQLNREFYIDEKTGDWLSLEDMYKKYGDLQTSIKNAFSNKKFKTGKTKLEDLEKKKAKGEKVAAKEVDNAKQKIVNGLISVFQGEDPKLSKEKGQQVVAVAATLGIDVEFTVGEDGKTGSVELKKEVDKIKKKIQDKFTDESSKNKILEFVDGEELSTELASRLINASDDALNKLTIYLKNNPNAFNKDIADFLTNLFNVEDNSSGLASKKLTDRLKALKEPVEALKQAQSEMADKGFLSVDTIATLEEVADKYGLTIDDLVVKTENGYALITNASGKLKEAMLKDAKEQLENKKNLYIQMYGLDSSYANKSTQATIDALKAKKKSLLAERDKILSMNRDDLYTKYGQNAPWIKYTVENEDYKKIDTAISDLEKYQKILDEISKDYDDLMKGTDGEAASKRWEKALATMKHRLAMGQISEKQYYVWVHNNNRKYLGNYSDTLDQRRAADEEWYQWQRTEFEKLNAEKQQQLSLNKISEKQYYAWLSKTYRQYLNNRNTDLEKQWEIEKQIYEYRKKAEKEELDRLKTKKDNAITGVTNLIDDQIDALNDQKQIIQDAYSKEIKAIEEKVEKLQKENDERKRAIELAKAEEELAKARRNRTRQVYRAGVGFVYEADKQAIADAQSSLTEVRNSNLVQNLNDTKDRLSKESQAATEVIDAQVKKYQEYKELWSDISKQHEDSVNKMRADEELGAGWEKQILEGRIDVIENFSKTYLNIMGKIDNYNAKYKESGAFTAADIDKIMRIAKNTAINTTGMQISENQIANSQNNLGKVFGNTGGNSNVSLSFGNITIANPVGDSNTLATEILNNLPNSVLTALGKNR